ncbi:hypothetical protein TNCV_4453341 [Trichonephila clavipes]|nr:hypothetical protein TNCV_4453341 [Trichonephila clavipes]
MQEPPFPRPPKETKITLNLLRPCSKKEDSRILKQKDRNDRENLRILRLPIQTAHLTFLSTREELAFSSNFQIKKERKMHKINTGLIASNFTSELLAIKEALIQYSTHLEL